jgi:hypothetical protein
VTDQDLQNAVIRIAGSLRESRPDEVRTEIDQLLPLAADSTFRERCGFCSAA